MSSLCNTRLVLLWALLLVATGGCGSSRPAPSTSSPSPSHVRVEGHLRAFVEDWDDTPYRLGGTTKRGADCSGFVMRAYSDLFDIALPRSTRRQVHAGTPIDRRELLAGDLVLFRTGRNTRHVGIYLSGGEFAHVSTSRGVTISRLNTEYWRDAYWTARRVLSPPEDDQAPAPASKAPSTDAASSPFGW